jgi:hypothetical protein
MKNITISISDDQLKWLNKKYINKSQLIQAFLQEQMKKDKQ